MQALSATPSAESTPSLDVLMYHSISAGPGPTCIDPTTFRMHVDLLAELGYQTVSLTQFGRWLEGSLALPSRSILITFDDGFVDFSRVAWPLLRERSLGAIVFLPTGHVGGGDVWETRSGHSSRPLMGWEEVQRLAAEGVEFGGHSVHHGDLSRQPLSDVRAEVAESKRELESRLNRNVLAFAPPYGRSTRAVRQVIRDYYWLSFGTHLGKAVRGSDLAEVPRIEMHYFRDPQRWRAHLTGGGRWWLAARRSLRTVRRWSRAEFRL
jgi:peptidoglycan/xylan/chitin deacetylase (PgdA/CDA1 family)